MGSLDVRLHGRLGVEARYSYAFLADIGTAVAAAGELGVGCAAEEVETMFGGHCWRTVVAGEEEEDRMKHGWGQMIAAVVEEGRTVGERSQERLVVVDTIDLYSM